MADLLPSTVVALDQFFRQMTTDLQQWVEDRVSTLETAQVDDVQTGISLGGETAEAAGRIDYLEVVGAQVEVDYQNRRGRVRVPPPGDQQAHVSLEFGFPGPVAPLDSQFLRLPFAAEIQAVRITADAPDATGGFPATEVEIRVGTQATWPSRGLIGPMNPAGVPQTITSDPLVAETIFGVTNWNVHFLEVGDKVRVEIVATTNPVIGVLVSLDLVKLSLDQLEAGALELTDGDGNSIQDGDGNIIVVRL